MSTAVDIALITDRVEDLSNQRELLAIQAELAVHGAELVPLKSSPPSDATAKSGEIEILAGSVHVILPAGVLAGVLTTLIRNYFKTKRARGIRFTRSDGSALEIRGYTGEQTADLIKSFVSEQVASSDLQPLE